LVDGSQRSGFSVQRAGGLEGWRAGGLEGWRAGGLEGWRARHKVAGVETSLDE
jgi:hypothetical protein